MVLIGNQFSGVAAAPELLPRPVGDLGQLRAAPARGTERERPAQGGPLDCVR
jgi:hypothetical protein